MVDGTSVGVELLKGELPQARRGRGRTDGYRRGRQGGRGDDRDDGQRRSRPYHSRQGVSTPCRWTRGPAGNKAIINSRRRSDSGIAVHQRVQVEMRPEGGKGVGEPDHQAAKGRMRPDQ